MVTKEQAVLAGATWGPVEFHRGVCVKHVGPRGGVRLSVETWRSNGRAKSWKTRPEAFRLPIKYGLYGYGAIDERNAGEYHLASECKPVEHRTAFADVALAAGR